MGRKRKFKNKEGKHVSVDTVVHPVNLREKTRNVTTSLDNDSSKGHAVALRKRVDPETAKYFLEIANLFESNGVDIDMRPTVCGNALEETRGKEIELATDMIISRTLQCLIEGCDLEQLCSFLRSCTEKFSCIAADKFGSHVAETALKSLSMHLQDEQSYLMVEEVLHSICQVVAADSFNIMCSPCGSHVLRSLLCLCKGVPLDALEGFHVTKPSAILAERLSCVQIQPGGNKLGSIHNSFSDTFNFLVHKILNHAKDEISSLRAEKYSSFVLQSLLKLSVGDDELLFHAILTILGCQDKSFVESRFTNATKHKLSGEVLHLIEDTSSSHLLEVIIEVAPEALYNELLDIILSGPVWDISSHHFGNFVMQALVSSARTREQVILIWEKLGPHLCQLLEAGKPGVVASILASCQRLQTCVDEFCKALSAATCTESGSPSCIITHLLHLDSYFRAKAHWMWPLGEKMNVLGCLMLQNIFKSSNSVARPYVDGMTCMDADHLLETAKDVGGSRVLEAFLCLDAFTKQKVEVITKLQGHFGELSMHPSGSFTVEKCFMSSNIPMREVIAAEVLNVRPELSKTKHGPHLLRKLDIEGFARSNQQWKSRQKSKAAAYRDFLITFGDKGQPESSEKKTSEKKRKRQENEPGNCNACTENNPSPPFLGSGKPRSLSRVQHLGDSRAVKFLSGKSFVRNSKKFNPASNFENKKSSTVDPTDLVDLARKSKLSQDDVQKLFDPKTSIDQTQRGMHSRKSRW